MRRAFFRKTPIRLAMYLLGFFVTGAGVVLIIRSDLGAGPWDAVTYNLSRLLGISLGWASFIVNSAVLAFVIAVRRKWRFLLVLIPIYGIRVSLDLWDAHLLEGRLMENPFALSALLYVFGTFVLTLGLALIIESGYPAMVFDEVMLFFMDLFRTESVTAVRLSNELFAIMLATVFGFSAGIRFGAVNLGSFVLAVLIAPILATQLRWLKGVIYEGEEKHSRKNDI